MSTSFPATPLSLPPPSPQPSQPTAMPPASPHADYPLFLQMEIYTDGSWASRSGHGGYGLAWRIGHSDEEEEGWSTFSGLAVALGQMGSNAEAEWRGIKAAVDMAHHFLVTGIVKRVFVLTDFQSAVTKYEVWTDPRVENEPDPRTTMTQSVKDVFQQCDSCADMGVFNLEYCPREYNEKADEMARRGRNASETGARGEVEWRRFDDGRIPR